jgi:hypothetical protein
MRQWDMETRKSWSEAEVNALIGQSESVRLEFKSGAMFSDQGEGKWRDELSKQVSAFANTEGGELILGIEEEKKAGARVAAKVDGVPAALPQERLQQIIEGNISPHLTGLRIQRVKLSASPDRVVFVIQVPPGVTAYQANDGRYYGRSEFEVKYLRDQEVRLRMTKGRVARAAVYPRIKHVVLSASKQEDLHAKHAAALEVFKEDPKGAFERFPELIELIGAGHEPDEISFEFVLKNDGELTIRDPAVKLNDVRPPALFDGLSVHGGSLPSRLEMRGEAVYPGDERDIAESAAKLHCRPGVALSEGAYMVEWKVFTAIP